MCVPSLESERPEEPEEELCQFEERSIGVAVAGAIEREPEAPRDEHSSDDTVEGSHLFLRSNLLLT
jgi:hypothetical protein